MRRPDALLHEMRWRPRWRALLFLLAGVAAAFAFAPGTGDAPSFSGADKLQHVLAFASMAGVGALGFASRARLAAGLTAYGVFIELVQIWVPGREASAADVAADAVGIALGLLLVAQARRRWPRSGSNT